MGGLWGSLYVIFCVALSCSSLEMKGKVEDLVLFLSDTAATLKSFVSIFPPGARCFWEAGAVTKLASFYDDVFPPVQHLWKTIASRLVQSQQQTVSLRWEVKRGGGGGGGCW